MDPFPIDEFFGSPSFQTFIISQTFTFLKQVSENVETSLNYEVFKNNAKNPEYDIGIYKLQ